MYTILQYLKWVSSSWETWQPIIILRSSQIYAVPGLFLTHPPRLHALRETAQVEIFCRLVRLNATASRSPAAVIIWVKCEAHPAFLFCTDSLAMLWLEINRKGRRQIGRAQLAGLSAETFWQFLLQPRHFGFSFGWSLADTDNRPRPILILVVL